MTDDLIRRLRYEAEMKAANRRLAEYGPAGGNPDAKAQDHLEWIAAAALERQDEALHQIKEWAEAYPLDVFPEPDFKLVAKVLEAAGLTLDAVSASNMRHVITRVRAIVDAALASETRSVK